MSGTDLYRFYDAYDRLLYVGISLHAAQRASEHRGDKSWWPDVERMHVTHLDVDRAEAHQIERQAILDDKPIHNITHNTPARTVTIAFDDTPVEFDATKVIGHNDLDLYLSLGKAMDALAARCTQRERDGDDVGNRADFIAAIQGLARSIVYGDCCDKCDEITYPMVLVRESNDGVRCGYCCGPCGHKWASWWTLDLQLLGAC